MEDRRSRRRPGADPVCAAAAACEIQVDLVEAIDLHSHRVTGGGASDSRKMAPNASRETLDHSIMCALAVALQDILPSFASTRFFGFQAL